MQAVYVFCIIGFFWILSGMKTLQAYERAVVFRLGKPERVIGPGISFVIFPFEEMVKVDLRRKMPHYKALSEDELKIQVREYILNVPNK